MANNENDKRAFFINIYNLLNIHSIVQFGTEHAGRFDMSGGERMKFYDKYQYNIGGHNLSLNDVEHGILRCNDAYGISKMKTYFLIVEKKKIFFFYKLQLKKNYKQMINYIFNQLY